MSASHDLCANSEVGLHSPPRTTSVRRSPDLGSPSPIRTTLLPSSRSTSSARHMAIRATLLPPIRATLPTSQSAISPSDCRLPNRPKQPTASKIMLNATLVYFLPNTLLPIRATLKSEIIGETRRLGRSRPARLTGRTSRENDSIGR